MFRPSLIPAVLVLAAGLVATACVAPHSHNTDSAPTAAAEPAPEPQPAPEPAPEPAPAPVAKAAPAAKAAEGMLVSELLLPTGDRDSSVLMIQKYGPAQVAVNQPYEYKLVVTNLIDGELNGVVVNDAFPQGFTIQSTTPTFPAGDVKAGNWVLGTMAANESRTVTVMGSASAPGVISSCTQASYNRAVCLTTTVVEPALKLELMAPAEVLICDDILVQYRLCNPGSGDANNIKVSAPYPEGLVDANGGKSLEKTFAKLAPGQCEEFSVKLRAEKRGSFAHNGSANADTGLSAKANTMTTVVRQPELAIVCDNPGDVFVGRQGNAAVTVTNKGDAVSANTVLKARLSEEFQFVSASNNGIFTETSDTITWQLGDLAPGQTVKAIMTVRTVAKGKGQVNARVEGVCAPEVVCRAEMLVKGIPAVLLEVIDENDPVVVGENEVYTITATNQGSAPDTNIRIVAVLPDNVQFVSATGATPGTAQGNRVTFNSLATLAEGAKATWKVVVKSVRAGNVRFRVSMNTDNLGATPVEETEATNFYE